MKNKLLTLLFAVVGMTIVSCSNNDTESVIPTPPITEVSVILPETITAKFINLLDSFTSDEYLKFRFSNENRLLSVWVDRDINGKSLKKGELKFYYDLDGNLEQSSFQDFNPDTDEPNGLPILKSYSCEDGIITVVITNGFVDIEEYKLSDDNKYVIEDITKSINFEYDLDGNLIGKSNDYKIGYDKNPEIFSNINTNSPAQTYLIITEIKSYSTYALGPHCGTNINNISYASSEDLGFLYRYNADKYPYFRIFTYPRYDWTAEITYY